MPNSFLWHNQKWLNKELIIWSRLPREKGKKAVCLEGQSLKMINLICKKIADRMEPSQPAFTILSQLS